MRAGKLQQRDDVRVRQGIDNVLPVPTRLHDTVVAQDAELMADGALRPPHRFDDVKHAHFALTKRKQNFQPRRVGNGFELGADARDFLVRGKHLFCAACGQSVLVFMITSFHIFFSYILIYE